MSSQQASISYPVTRQAEGPSVPRILAHAPRAAILVALAAAVWVWLLAIKAPLWLDETGTFWVISSGLSRIWGREKPIAFYHYALWLWQSAFGTSEATLRLLSVLASLAAAYLFYRIALRYFDRSTSLIATCLFCLHPLVIFASVDVRPYAFALVALNGSILLLLRWTDHTRMHDAILLGLSAALLVNLRYIAVTMLPALVVCWFILRPKNWSGRQALTCVAVCGMGLLPVLMPYMYIFQTRAMHNFARVPQPAMLWQTIAPGSLWIASVCVLVLGAVLRRLRVPLSLKPAAVFMVLAFTPLVLLYGISTLTSSHVFVPRYELFAVPGLALCWTITIAAVQMPVLRVGFCLVLTALSVQDAATAPMRGTHGYSWKESLAAADQAALQDGSLMLVCSDFPEANYAPLESFRSDDTGILAPLSYYKVHSPVVPLSRTLNEASKQQIARVLADPSLHANRRFIFVGYFTSMDIFRYLAAITDERFKRRLITGQDSVVVVEFSAK